jgi:CubicO group peptidase (beta-lactamase class C family)
MLRRALALLILWSVYAGACWADELDAYIRHEMGVRKIPGLAFAVTDHGKIAVQRAYGSANLETDTPLDTNGVFEIASVTKPFTATAIMLLVEDGKIRLGDPISKFVDHVPAAWNEITVRELLSHTSGIEGGSWVECDGSPLLNISTRQYFEQIAKSPLQFAPGTSAAYSDSGYFLLGMIIEKVSGMRYSEFMQRRVFSPFGMTSTSILDRRVIVKKHVSEYTLHEGQLQHERRVWQHDLPSFFGMLSTAGDLAKWNIALTEGRVLRPETLKQMWTATRVKDGQMAQVDGLPYGLGWFVWEAKGHRVVGHPGFLGSVMFNFVDDKYALIVLTNLDVASGISHEVIIGQGIVAHLRPDLPRFIP